MKIIGHIWMAGGIAAMIVGLEGKDSTFALGIFWTVLGQVWAIMDERKSK